MRAEVVTQTEDLPRERWLELRRLGLGGSDAPAVVGMSTWASPYAVYLDKTGALGDDPVEKPWMKMGRLLEDAVAQGFAEETGLDVRRFPVMLRDRENRYMLANLDRLIGGADLATATALLECKYAVQSWKWDDGPPVNYQLQVAHYLAVTGLPQAVIAVLLDGRIKSWEVERDESLIVDLVEVERDFWARVEERRPPPVDGLPATTEALNRIRAREGLEIALPEDARKLIADLRYAKHASKAAKEHEDAVANHLRTLMGEAEIGLLDGEVVVTWRQHERENVDIKRMKLELPDAVAPYKSKTPYRSLLLKKEND